MEFLFPVYFFSCSQSDSASLVDLLTILRSRPVPWGGGGVNSQNPRSIIPPSGTEPDGRANDINRLASVGHKLATNGSESAELVDFPRARDFCHLASQQRDYSTLMPEPQRITISPEPSSALSSSRLRTPRGCNCLIILSL